MIRRANHERSSACRNASHDVDAQQSVGMLGWSGVVEDVVQILDYLLVAAGLSHVLANSVDIVSDLFVCQDHRGCTPQRLPVDLFAPHHRSQLEFNDSRPYRQLIVDHGNHHHGHLVVKSFVHAAHAAMRDEQVALSRTASWSTDRWMKMF